MAFVPETFILYPEKLNFASDKAAYTYMKRYIFSLYICKMCIRDRNFHRPFRDSCHGDLEKSPVNAPGSSSYHMKTVCGLSLFHSYFSGFSHSFCPAQSLPAPTTSSSNTP